MFKRIMTSVVGIPLLVIIVSQGGLPIVFSLILLTTIGLWEFYNTVQLQGNKIHFFVECILSVFLLIIMYKYQEFLTPYIILLFMFHMIYQLFTKDASIQQGLLRFSGIIYITLLLGHLLLFDTIEYGRYFIWLVFIIAWSTDTFAYFTGRFLGRKKLCPSISPNKTIEGSIGGIMGALFASAIFGLYLKNLQSIPIDLVHFIILGMVTSIISQLGDLVASLIKRNYGVKDFGFIFPGHGGVLDRFDSILFTAPIVYYYITIII